jgi:hypothetical protein
MDGMSRTGTTATALLAGLALLATLPAPCGCLPEPAVAEHSCCAPPPGLRASGGGCCVAPDAAPETPAAKPAAPLALPVLAAAQGVWSVSVPVRAARAAAPEAAHSPPLTVRRL